MYFVVILFIICRYYCVCVLQTVIELKTADKHDTVQSYTLYHQQDDTVTASSSITSAASLEVRVYNVP